VEQLCFGKYAPGRRNDYNIEKEHFDMNIWHDVSPKRVQKEDFFAVIEITKGGKAKYELDKAKRSICILTKIPTKFEGQSLNT